MIDALIITSIRPEFEAARAIALETGLKAWHEENSGTTLAHLRGTYSSGGREMNIALWKPSRMGGITIGSLIGALIEQLEPRCLAMCGVCAGNPEEVALGDVIFAEMTYQYDEGKREHTGFIGDHRQTPMSSDWVLAAQEFDPSGLLTYGIPDETESRSWILDRLYAGDDPLKHPARPRYFPASRWESSVRQLEAEDFVHRDGLTLALTHRGRTEVETTRFYQSAPPSKLPFEVKVGPIASGNAVVKDGVTWKDLTRQGVRTVMGLDMEAATIGNTARGLNIPYWVVVKAVMDHADYRKDDRFKPFAARASAEVLLKFLTRQLHPDTAASKPPRSNPLLLAGLRESLKPAIAVDLKATVAASRDLLIWKMNGDLDNSVLEYPFRTKEALTNLREVLLSTGLAARFATNPAIPSDPDTWKGSVHPEDLTLLRRHKTLSICCCCTASGALAALALLKSKFGIDMFLRYEEGSTQQLAAEIVRARTEYDFIFAGAFSLMFHVQKQIAKYKILFPCAIEHQYVLVKGKEVASTADTFRDAGRVFYIPETMNEIYTRLKKIPASRLQDIQFADLVGLPANLDFGDALIAWEPNATAIARHFQLKILPDSAADIPLVLCVLDRHTKSKEQEKLTAAFTRAFVGAWNYCVLHRVEARRALLELPGIGTAIARGGTVASILRAAKTSPCEPSV